jgi:arsenite methyltransferase
VLDLGSGGGIDVLLSAQRVGPTGHAYGLDMTDEMLDLARREQAQERAGQRALPQGRDRQIPLPDNSVDVIISNCVINLAADKDRCCAKPSACSSPAAASRVSDVVVRGEVPDAIRRNMELWIGCVAGALSDRDYLDKLAAAGFADAGIEITRVYGVDDAREFLARRRAPR